MAPHNQEERSSPPRLILKAAALVILAGTGLLSLPWATRDGVWTEPLVALFMATSATCVTGHTVVDVGSYFTPFGQTVLMILCQLGGLGFMTLVMFVLAMAGRRLSIQSEKVLTLSLGVDEAGELKALLFQTIFFTFILELAGALVLAARLVAAHGFSWAGALYHGLFLSICAFCNAGFSLRPDNLISFRHDPVVLVVIMALIVIGGLGFLVLHDLSLYKFWKRNRLERRRPSLHTRMALRATFVLLTAGWLLIALLEWNRTLAPLDTVGKLLCSLFQSVAPRTAGFNVIDMAEARDSTRFVTIVLMFVGGSPGSTAGGIKTTTAMVLLATLAALVRGRLETTLFGRTLSMRIVEESLAIFLLGVLIVTASFGLLLITEEAGLMAGRFTANALLFENISAFATVGLTTGIVPDLSVAGKLVLVAGMFLGRVGPLTVALVVGAKETRRLVRFPEEDIMIG